MELTIAGEEQGMNYRMRAGRNLEDVASAVRESWLYGVGEEAQPIEVDPTTPTPRSWRILWAASMRAGPITAITPAEARHVLRVILSIQQSLETGGRCSCKKSRSKTQSGWNAEKEGACMKQGSACFPLQRRESEMGV